MNQFICIHGHFYQPPRENPWLETIELQEFAYPYHDWNERISSECYAPNTLSRILNHEHRIIDIVNNYSRMSFNFGATLLSWMEKYDTETYYSILQADKIGLEKFSGHGPAIAQAYNHIILPLANKEDKKTQIIWGIKDFQLRFQRAPEGMWASETAIDIESLEIMAAHNIKFTILAPRQAGQIRKMEDGKDWINVSDGSVNPKRPYLCKLPSGKEIAIFFYDGPVSQNIAFGDVLKSGENFSNRLVELFDPNSIEPELVHIATDGETYGHHHMNGDMALAYCFDRIEKHNLGTITCYGEYLEKCPPVYEVQIIENSSWSCDHGVERWRKDCGCNTGGHSDWNQSWRTPLREALDWLRDNINLIFHEKIKTLIKDPWKARNNYIDVILERNEETIEKFFNDNCTKELTPSEKSLILKTFEVQRNSMLMYTSCGWFFDELSGIETVQILKYAGRIIQLAQEIYNVDFEESFLAYLKRAKSNIPNLKNGAVIYEKYVKPSVVNLRRVAGHFAIASLFEKEFNTLANLDVFEFKNIEKDLKEAGKYRLVIGKLKIASKLTLEEDSFNYCALYLGGHDIVCGVSRSLTVDQLDKINSCIEEHFYQGKASEIIRLIDSYYGNNTYSMWHLFKDKQSEILNYLVKGTMDEIEVSLNEIYKNHFMVMQASLKFNISIPKFFMAALEYVFSEDLLRLISSDDCNEVELKRLTGEINKWSIHLDYQRMALEFEKRINKLILKFVHNDQIESYIEKIIEICNCSDQLKINLNLWRTQNIFLKYIKLNETLFESKIKEDNVLQKLYHRLLIV